MYSQLKSLNIATLITSCHLVIFSPGLVVAQEKAEKTTGQIDDSERGLYSLVEASCKAKDLVSAERFSKRYFTQFPKGQFLDRVKMLMLESLFHAGEYEKALALSTEVLAGKKLAEKSKLNDLATHVKGGSLHYLGRYAEALPLLQKHVESYPVGEYVLASRYFEAANYCRNQEWNLAAEKLDNFFNDYRDKENNIYYPYALYDRAETYFATMQEYSREEYDRMYHLLAKIENEFKGSNVEAQAFILRGDVLRVERKNEKSKSYYLKALKVAEQQSRKEDAGHALYKLMSLLVRDDSQAALGYYDRFWKEYPHSDYKANVAVVGMPLMISAKRGEEALGNLQRVIADLSQQENAPALEAVIRNFVKYYLKLGQTIEDLENLILNSPGHLEPRVLAFFYIALIDQYESLLKKEKENTKEADKLRLKIKLKYYELNAGFKLSDLSDFLLMRIGNHFVDGKRLKDGLIYFEQILKNGRPQFRATAMYQKAIILSLLGDNGGLKLLSEIIEDKDNLFEKRTKDKALFEMIKIHVEKGNGKKVIELARMYGERGYQINKREALLLLAQGYDMVKDFDKAISAYHFVYARYRSNWEISVPALMRAAELQWEHGKGLDHKQVAYNSLARFLKVSARPYAKHKFEMGPQLIKDYEALKALAKKWEKDKGIKLR